MSIKSGHFWCGDGLVSPRAFSYPYYQRLAADGKVRYGEKSYLLPNGRRIGYRWSEARWEVTDASALEDWAKGRGLVRVTETADWGAQVKPRLVPLLEEVGAEAVDKATGDLVPGVRLARPAGDVFAVTASRRRPAATEQPREG